MPAYDQAISCTHAGAIVVNSKATNKQSAAPLLSVENALARATAGLAPSAVEHVALEDADARVLASDVAARRAQPPAAMSAMDGYAMRAQDIATCPATLKLVGTAPAGHPFAGSVGPGEALRLFTGSQIPKGANTVVMQENTTTQDGNVTILKSAPKANFIRPRAMDFDTGDVLLKTGQVLGPAHLALAAAMNHAGLDVFTKPIVAILATGDELVRPGPDVGTFDTIVSNNFGLAALVARLGGVPVDIGIARDSEASLNAALDKAANMDLLVTTGGASVGDHDLVQQVLVKRGLDLDFWRIAMRPGKPLMHGNLGKMRFLGLPGNPVSALVCAQVFLVPMLAALTGRPHQSARHFAKLGADLPANNQRQAYLRASLSRDGDPVATPFEGQDSAMLAGLARADCLVVRPPHAPAAQAGARTEIMMLDI
ncbi:MAG: molybdopterin molybdotransferase MoeA [Alphaproteobacteria bacterium]